MKYKLSKKNDQGKWWSYGYFAENQWGNYQASFKVTQELKKVFAEAEEGSYINFSAFEDKGKPSKHQQDKANGYQPDDLDDQVPF